MCMRDVSSTHKKSVVFDTKGVSNVKPSDGRELAGVCYENRSRAKTRQGTFVWQRLLYVEVLRYIQSRRVYCMLVETRKGWVVLIKV